MKNSYLRLGSALIFENIIPNEKGLIKAFMSKLELCKKMQVYFYTVFHPWNDTGVIKVKVVVPVNAELTGSDDFPPNETCYHKRTLVCNFLLHFSPLTMLTFLDFLNSLNSCGLKLFRILLRLPVDSSPVRTLHKYDMWDHLQALKRSSRKFVFRVLGIW